jgi:hypothetical protein
MATVVSSVGALARVMGESHAQFLARPVMTNLFLEGVAEEPLVASTPWLARSLQFSSAQDPGESLAKLLLG